MHQKPRASRYYLLHQFIMFINVVKLMQVTGINLLCCSFEGKNGNSDLFLVTSWLVFSNQYTYRMNSEYLVPQIRNMILTKGTLTSEWNQLFMTWIVRFFQSQTTVGHMTTFWPISFHHIKLRLITRCHCFCTFSLLLCTCWTFSYQWA